MANPVLRYITMFQGKEGYGWSEVHCQVAAAAAPPLDGLLNGFLNIVCPARAAMLGEDCSIVGARVSYRHPKGIRSFALRKKIDGVDGVSGSAPALSLAVNFANQTFDRTKIVHVRGFFDSVEFEESYRPDLGGDWEARLIAWKQTLIQGNFGWLSVDDTLSSNGDVSGYVVGADHRVTFTLAAPGINVAFVGTRQQVRFSRFGNGKSILNRSILVDVTSTTECVSVKKIGADPVSSTGHFNHRATSFAKYFETASISLGERRMGKPLNRLPGRSAVRPLF